MTITIRLFAILRERAGDSELSVNLPTGATVADARDALLQKYSELSGLLSRVAYAVNRSYAPAGRVLDEGDEVAFIPPVSGG